VFGRLDIQELNNDLRLLAEAKTRHLVTIEVTLHELWDKRNGDPEVLKSAIKGIGQELTLIVAALKNGEAHLCIITDFATLESLERADRFAAHLRMAVSEIADYLADRLSEATPVAS
jgi:hypothetical protein